MAVISYTQISDNTPATANVFNTRFGDIIEQINGKLDASNIQAGSITRELFANDAIQAAWPVDSVYISVTNVNPSTLFGGNWIAFGTGRTLVGVDATQTEFNAVEKTGGHKSLQAHTHTGSTSTAGNHSHTYSAWRQNTYPSGGIIDFGGGYGNPPISTGSTSSAGDHSHTFTTASSGAGDSQNLQPYITVYFWKRTS